MAPTPPVPPISDIEVSLTGGSAKADASANDFADVLYKLDGAPRIVATRSGSNVVVSYIGSSLYSNFRVYSASDHRATFSELSSSTTLPYTHSGIDTSLNYKYKASFVATGTKDGSPYEEESQKSRPAYTIGTRKI